MIYIKREASNYIVTDFYLHIIGKAFKRLEQRVEYCDNLCDISFKAGDLVVVSNIIDAWRLIIKKIPYILWTQGILPEESYLRHASIVRKYGLSYLEKIALQKAKMVFLVSKSMLMFYESKYKLELKNYYIMPCGNEEWSENNWTRKTYKKNRFCYAGGTGKWQCLDNVFYVYKKIEAMDPQASLLLLVKENDYIRHLVDKYEVKNCEIRYVLQQGLAKQLEDVKFGFVLREDYPVNHVATPTKILTYITHGIIPIYTSCLSGVYRMMKQTDYAIECKDLYDFQSIELFLDKNINEEKIHDEYKDIYYEFYDPKRHEDKIYKYMINNKNQLLR